jgi:hypothetical protein
MGLIRRSAQREEPDYKFGAEYMGGHKAFPKKKDTDVLIFHDRIILKSLGIDIPFSSIKNMENSDAERITKTRVFLTGPIIGLLWKKKFLYTVIDYNDGMVDQTVILDLHRSVQEAQTVIYQRMLASRKPEVQGQASTEEHNQRSGSKVGGSPF